VQAFELGYFAVPKEATIEEVADELGVSLQAVSQ
jgi:predicted DNA binding protein